MRTLNLADSKSLLERHGVKFAPSGTARTPEEAMIIANNLGYPVALKVVSDGVSHKTDVGGVAVGISDDRHLQDAYRKMVSGLKRKAPKAKVKGVMVQKMVEGGVEVLIGGKKDPEFGQVVAFGLGGVFVEIMEDVAFRVAPVSKKEAADMMAETRGFKVLDGYRGKSYDVEAVATLISKVSSVLEKRKDIVELDMNPVIVLKKGAVAVDARIVLDG